MIDSFELQETNVSLVWKQIANLKVENRRKQYSWFKLP